MFKIGMKLKYNDSNSFWIITKIDEAKNKICLKTIGMGDWLSISDLKILIERGYYSIV